jgi:FAD binding domain
MDVDALRGNLSGEAALPGTSVYDEGRTVWYPPARCREPLAVVRPAGTEDVARTLRWARDQGVRVSPRSGGHSFDGFPVRPGCLLLDLSPMRDARLEANGLLRVQPGARVLALAEALAPAGRALPLGDCGTVALGGLMSGGGFGYASRQFGLTIDNLVEATVVTGNGDVLRVDADTAPDLYWSCRGGGGSACIVTEFVVRSFVAGEVTAFDIVWDWAAPRDALLGFDSVIRSAPRNFDLKLKIRTTDEGRFLDSTVTGPQGCTPGTPFVELSGQYLGPRAEAEALLAPLSDHPAAQKVLIRQENYFAAVRELLPLPGLNDPAPPTLRPFRVASDFVERELRSGDVDVLVGVLDDLQHARDLSGGCILLEPADGAVHDLAGSATAYPHRKGRLLVQWEMIEPSDPAAAGTARLDALLSDTREALSPILTGGRYVNYADRMDTTANWWSENLGELRSIAAANDRSRTIVSRLWP